jgi:hypothetical protein
MQAPEHNHARRAPRFFNLMRGTVMSVFDRHTFGLNWLTACGVRNVIGYWLLQLKLKKVP